MTDQIRDAAQALIDAQDGGTMLDRNISWAALRRVLSAPQPAADERVAEHMRLIDDAISAAKALTRNMTNENVHLLNCAEVAVEASARTLLCVGAQHTPGVMTMPIRGWRRASVLPECDDVFTTYQEEAQQWGDQAHVVVDYADHLSAIAALQAQIAELEARQVPIDMVLHCPACGLQHIDAPEELPMGLPGGFTEGSAGWTNPPHRSHLCHGCGHIWRPSDVPTNGVAAVKTRGKNDSWATAAAPSNPTTQPPDGQDEAQQEQSK